MSSDSHGAGQRNCDTASGKPEDTGRVMLATRPVILSACWVTHGHPGSQTDE